MDELKIIKYLDGEMSPEESRAFEKELGMNPSLAEELENYRKIQELAENLLGDEDEAGNIPEKEIADAVDEFKKDPGSFDKVSEEFRSNLDAAQRDFHDSRDRGSVETNGMTDPVGNPPPIRVIHRIWYRAAAIIILAVILSILIFKPFSESTPDELYARYSRPFQKTEQVMEIARNDNDFLFAVEVFEAGDFERAIVLFEMLADSSKFRTWSLLYAGNSYMSINRSAEAIEIFRELILSGDADVLPHAHWQLAMGYLKTGKPDMAREHLEILAKDPVYRNDARRIIRIVY